MSFSISAGAPMRIGAIVLAFVVLGGGYFLLGPGKPKTATATHRLVRHPHGLQSFAHKVAPAKASARKNVPAKTAAPAKAKHEAAPVSKAKATAKPQAQAKPKPKPVHVALLPNLPDGLAAALQQHSVVVVSIYNPEAPDDQIALAEASAGAGLAGVGFVGLSVLDQDQIGPVTRMIGVVDDPTLLIYQRPGQVIGRLHGFADSQTVAQAVQNAAPAAVSHG